MTCAAKAIGVPVNIATGNQYAAETAGYIIGQPDARCAHLDHYDLWGVFIAELHRIT